MWSLGALVTGCVIDLLVGDPHGFPHPVIGIGKLIAALERLLRRWFPSTKRGERLAGLVLWILVCAVSTAVPALVLWGLRSVSPWLSLAAESIMCWQILAAKSLKTESMKVYDALKRGSLERARYAVSMIVGRDTDALDEAGVTRAAVETVAENTSDGVIAPLLFMAILGAPFGFFYKAVNTMDSMLGYTDPPYNDIGLVPARADDVVNFIPARISALMLLLAGKVLNGISGIRRGGGCRTGRGVSSVTCRGGGRMRTVADAKKAPGTGGRYDIQNGWRIFLRDRYRHASPNSAQTESVCAGLLRVQLAGDAWYHGILHKKPLIGDPLRPIAYEDIPSVCRLMYAAAGCALVIFGVIRLVIVLLAGI